MSYILETIAIIMHSYAYILLGATKMTSINARVVEYTFEQKLARIMRVDIFNIRVDIGTNQVVIPK